MSNWMKKHTHFHPPTKTWFTLGECENCRKPIQEPNAVSCHNSIDELKEMGVIIVDELPPEIGHDDNLGISCCDNCPTKDGEFVAAFVQHQVEVEFKGTINVEVPGHLSEYDQAVLARHFAPAKMLATADNPDSPDDEASESFLEDASDQAVPEDWDQAAVVGVGGTWTAPFYKRDQK